MSVIVTGINGQDGYYMCKYLLEHTSFMIYGTLRYRATKLTNAKEYFPDNPRFTMLHLDITDNVNVLNIIKKVKPQYFINFAAQSFVGKSWDIPHVTWTTNTMGVINILDSLKTECSHCRFYNAGTSEEFGDVLYSPQNEDHPLRPRSPYAASKCAARHIIRVYRESYGMYAIQGWLFNHESIRRGKDFVTRKITSTIASIKKNIESGERFEPLELGNMNAKRDWGDAEDFIDGVWKMLNQDTPPSEYILSSGTMYSVRDFLEECLRVADIQWSRCDNDVYVHTTTGEVISRVNSDYYRLADVNCLMGNNKKARLELDWTPKTDFSTLVRKMFEHDYL